MVPYIEGKPFLRKPPLVNWAIAGSFKLFGVQNEWSARLPSVLAILGLALGIVAISGPGKWMSVETALVAAIFSLTQLAVLDKGRLAEIEAIYSALSGLAILLWLAWWGERRSPWLIWTVPFVFLGLAFLAKGPMHLLFFYAIVVCIAVQTRDSKALLHPAHFVGILLMAGIFAAWLIPYRHNEATIGATEVWKHQMASRVAGKFDLVGWATNIPRGLSDHLPWLLLVPVLWRRGLDNLGERGATIFKGTRLAMIVTFFGLLLIPGVLPRYTMPLLTPFALLLAITLTDSRLDPLPQFLRPWWRTNQVLAIALIAAALAGPAAVAIILRESFKQAPGESIGDFTDLLTWPLIGSGLAIVLCLAVFLGRWKMARPALIATASGIVISSAMLIYASSLIPIQNRHDSLRPIGQSINKLIPAGQVLFIYDCDYQPSLFYLRVPYRYAVESRDVPKDARWLLVRADNPRHQPKDDWPDYEVAAEFPQRSLKKIALIHRKGSED